MQISTEVVERRYKEIQLNLDIMAARSLVSCLSMLNPNDLITANQRTRQVIISLLESAVKRVPGDLDAL